MAFPLRAKTRNEQLWVVPETTFDVLAQPDIQHLVEILPGGSFPQASPEYVPSQERRGSAGVKTLLKRKVRPAAWTFGCYAYCADKAGDPPGYGELLRVGMGVQTLATYAALTTALAGTHNDLVYTARIGGTGGNSLQVEYLVAGANTPLTVTATATKVTVNVATNGASAATSTASQVRDAVRASVAAMAIMRSVELAGANDGTGVVTALTATNLTGGAGTAQVTYSLATDVDELTVSLWHFTDNLMRGFRGGVVTSIRLEGSGSDEPKLTFSGLSTGMVFAGVAKLEGAVNNSVTAFVLEAGHARRFKVGPDAGDVLHLQIESEIVKLTAVDYATDTLTVVRAQLGTTGASHADAIELGPWKPAASTEPADFIAPVVLGDILLNGVSTVGASFALTIDNTMEPRLDEYAQPDASGFRRSGRRQVTGQLRAYATQESQRLLSNLDRETVEDLAILLGSTGTGRLTVNVDRARMLAPPEVDGGGPEFAFAFPFQGVESVGNDETTWVFD